MCVLFSGDVLRRCSILQGSIFFEKLLFATESTCRSSSMPDAQRLKNVQAIASRSQAAFRLGCRWNCQGFSSLVQRFISCLNLPSAAPLQESPPPPERQQEWRHRPILPPQGSQAQRRFFPVYQAVPLSQRACLLMRRELMIPQDIKAYSLCNLNMI